MIEEIKCFNCGGNKFIYSTNTLGRAECFYCGSVYRDGKKPIFEEKHLASPTYPVEYLKPKDIKPFDPNEHVYIWHDPKPPFCTYVGYNGQEMQIAPDARKYSRMWYGEVYATMLKLGIPHSMAQKMMEEAEIT